VTNRVLARFALLPEIVIGWLDGTNVAGIVQMPGRLDEIRFGDDVVSVEDGACLVTGQLHGHPLRDSGPDEIANRRATEIVHETTR